MLDVRDLELVLAITSHGSFARAARVLGVGQPALTRHVAALEHKLRAPLFIRGNHGAEPTDLCRVMVSAAGDIVQRVRDLTARLGHARGDQSSDLTVVAGGYAAETVGMQAVARMLSLGSNVQIRFATLNWTQAVARLRDREAEAALLEISEVEKGDDLVIEPLHRHTCWFAAREGHPLTRRKRVSLAEIFEFPLCYIGRIPDRVLLRFVDARQRAQSGRTYPAFPAVVVESPSAALLVVARSSDAVVPVSCPVVTPWLQGGGIALLPWHEHWGTTNFGIADIRARPLSAAMQTFIDCVREVDQAAYADAVSLLGHIGAH